MTVNVSATATTPQVNSIAVSGGGSVTANTSDSTTIVYIPVLSITKAHTGDFKQGQIGATYTITVSNSATAAPTNNNGTLTVVDPVPTGMTLVSMSGDGWTCAAGGIDCRRDDVLAPGASYPPITVTANVGATAASPLVNQATVTGGRRSPGRRPPRTANVALNPPVLSIAKTTWSFTQGQTDAAYTVTVSNQAGATPTNGVVTVTETVPTGLTLVSMAGTGWTCVAAVTHPE